MRRYANGTVGAWFNRPVDRLPRLVRRRSAISGWGVYTAQRIEKGLVTKLRLESRVTVLTAKEMRAVIDDNPFAAVATEPSRFLVAVPSTKSDLEKLRPHLVKDWSPECFALGSRVAYMWCPGGILESGVNDVVSRTLRDAVTVRNWATISKLQALV